MRRIWTAAISFFYVVALTLAFSAPAQAWNDGRGFYGATNDKATVNMFFGVIAFFPVFVFAMSMLQKALEKRKEARKAAEKQLRSAPWRGGW